MTDVRWRACKHGHVTFRSYLQAYGLFVVCGADMIGGWQCQEHTRTATDAELAAYALGGCDAVAAMATRR